MENLSRRAGLDDFSLIHHGDAVGDVVDDAKVMGDENHRQPEVFLERGDEIEDLRLDGDIECGDRFVGDDELRFRGERAGDGDALALAAGEFVRMTFASRPTVAMSVSTRWKSASPFSFGWRWRTASARVEKIVIRGLSEA